ncbi:MAG: hypothetical protein R2877_03700 [Bdellovibrionota bacterium]
MVHAENGWEISNIDSTIMTENQLRPHIKQMTSILAKTMNIHPEPSRCQSYAQKKWERWEARALSFTPSRTS